MKEIFKFLKDTWAFILATTGGLVALFNFVQLWQGNQKLLIWVLACSALLSVILILLYVGFSKKSSSIQLPRGEARQISRFPQHYELARISIIFVILSSAVFGVLLYQKHLQLKEKVVILVADFYGPEPENYQVTDSLIFQLNETIKKYKDNKTLIVPLNQVITEQGGGSTTARKLGEQNYADIVIWGRYSVDGETVYIDFNIENLSSLKNLPLAASSPSEFPGERAQFKFRQQFSKQMTAFTLFISGMASFEKRDYPTAFSRFDQSLNQGEWNEDILSKKYPLEMRGLATLVSGNIGLTEINSAISDFSMAIEEIDNNDPDLYFDRGFAYLLSRNAEKAIEDFTQALKFRPSFANAFYDRALMYSEVKDYQKAIDDYTQVIRLEPESYWGYYQRGVTFAIREDFTSAIQDFTQAIRFCSGCADAYVVRGKAYASVGDYKNAFSDLNQGIELKPSAEAFIERGSIYYDTNNWNSAIEDFSQAINIDPKNAKTFNQRGMTYRNAGALDNAIQDFSAAITLNPKMVEAFYNRGNTYYDLGKYKEAAKDYTEATNIEPKFTQAYLYLAHTYERLGNFKAALLNFTRVIALDPQSAEGYCYRGTVLSEMGNSEEGLTDLNKAISLAPNYDEAYYNRAITYANLGDTVHAIADLKMVLSISKNPGLIQNASKTLIQLGQTP